MSDWNTTDDCPLMWLSG